VGSRPVSVENCARASSIAATSDFATETLASAPPCPVMHRHGIKGSGATQHSKTHRSGTHERRLTVSGLAYASGTEAFVVAIGTDIAGLVPQPRQKVPRPPQNSRAAPTFRPGPSSPTFPQSVQSVKSVDNLLPCLSLRVFAFCGRYPQLKRASVSPCLRGCICLFFSASSAPLR
jgi:hypothetical protein